MLYKSKQKGMFTAVKDTLKRRGLSIQCSTRLLLIKIIKESPLAVLPVSVWFWWYQLHCHITVIIAVEIEDTVLDCLDRLNRTMLLDDDDDSLKRRLGNSSIKTTLFLPTETALMNTEVTIADHLVNGSFRAETLATDDRQMTTDDQLLTAVSGILIHIKSTCVNVSLYFEKYYCLILSSV